MRRHLSAGALSAPRAFALGIAILAFGSCQDSGQSSPTGTSSPTTYLATLPTFPGSWAMPDSVVWRQGDDSTRVDLEVDSLEAIASRSLDAPPRDTVRLRLWRFGIAYGTIRYRHVGTPVLAYVDRDLDAFSLAVFSRVGTRGTRDSFHLAYARALLADSLAQYASYPDRAPLGLDTAAVTRALAIAMASSDKPYAELIASQAIDLDSAALRKRIQSLTDSGVIRDTTILFQGRDGEAPRVERRDGTRDTTVEHGIDSLRLEWKVTDDRQLGNVRIEGDTVGGKDDVFARTVSLRDGRNTIRLVAMDAAGNSATDSVVVTRKPAPVDTVHPDTSAPVVARRSGTRDTSVAHGVDSITLEWTITDDRGIALVRIGGEAVSSSDSVYRRKVALAEGANVVRCDAVDASGNRAFDAIAVIRLAKVDTVHPDTSAPVVARRSGTRDTSVAHGVDSITLEWTVTDDRKIALVRIGSEPVSGSDSVYRRKVALAEGTNVVRLLAVDASGNIATDSVSISRLAVPDTSAPVLERVDGTRDTGVGGAGDSLLSVGWVVRDNGRIASVRIDGVAVPSLDSVYTRLVPIAVGTDTIRIVATDAAGNVSHDSIVVTRSAYHDTIAPVIAPADTATRDKQVGWFTKSVTLSWTVSDNDQIKATWFANCDPRISGNTFTCTYPLTVGANSFTAKAYDTAGNVSSLKVVVTRSQIDTLVASWAFPSKTQETIPDLTGHGLDLTLDSTGCWKRAQDTALSILPTGRLLIRARVWLDRYPSSGSFNRSSMIVGIYADLAMMVTDLGELMVVSQRTANGANTWYGPRTDIQAVPLGRWVDLAVGADDNRGELHAWIDGVPQTMWSPNSVPEGRLRCTMNYPFMVGYNKKDVGQVLTTGVIDSIRVYSRFVLGAGKPVSGVKECVATICMAHPDTVATWNFTSDTMSTVASVPAGRKLTKTAKGQWKMAWDTLLVPALPDGRILYQATIRLDAYPSVTTYNGAEMVMGFYPGLKFGVDTVGRVVVTVQRGSQGYKWYGVRTKDAIPRGRDVDIAVGVDQKFGEVFVWINGVAVMSTPTNSVATAPIRVASSTTPFTVGYDYIDGQAFSGIIRRAAVYKDFVLGRPYFPE